MTRYRRVLLKLSGAAVAGDGEFGFEQQRLTHISNEINALVELGMEIVIVIGGGNIFRGNTAETWGIERAEADSIGTLATVLNSLMLRGVLRASTSRDVRVMTAVPMNTIAEPYIRLRAIHHLEKGHIVILAGGNGQPYVTTDYPSVQRAIEIRCDAVLAAKHGVDGVYDQDPRQNPAAKRYTHLNYEDAISQGLRVMDQSSILLARDFHLPVHVFDFNQAGAMTNICLGEEADVGTLVYAGKTNLYED
ncbi:UMP kinase [Alicyclobacillus fodiniaquatilis]|jgi:uridylate kinase|uniref:Uridylate kinase n=1 Tax=Alicyclobacillus fodiniaquatilis TaxID=1661150 RepID=A0ABW4JKU2_9BACL